MNIMSDSKKYIRVACRLCGKEMLFPRESYQEEDLIGWECRGSLSHSCKIAYERDKRKRMGE